MTILNGVEVDSSTQELVDAQAQVWSHIYNFINSMTLKCAIQLGIPDAIHKHGKPMTLSDLVRALSINPSKSNGLYRLMRVLVHSKFFDKVKVRECEEEEAYCLTPTCRLLIRDDPLSIAPFAIGALDPIMMDPFQYLSEWFQNEDSTPFYTKNGRNVWDYTGSDPKWKQLYHDAMASDSRLVAGILVKECKHMFEGVEALVEVGGGTGMVSKALADAMPGLKCTVLELPQVVAGVEGSESVSFVGGDMFEFIPHADAVLLKWNLSMWSYEDSVKLMKKCKEAISSSRKSGRKVIIVEIVVEDQKEDDKAAQTHLFYDMHIMSRFAGGERTQKEWEKLFFDSGFKSYKISPVLGLRSVIQVFP